LATYQETFKRVMEGDYTDASDAERDAAVQDVIRVGAIAAAATSVTPIPLADIAAISAVQIAMIQAIGRVRGFNKLDKTTILEILASFGAGLVAQNVIMTASNLLFFLGPLVKAPMAYATTWAIGEVGDYYFKSGQAASSHEMRDMFKQVYKQKKAEKEAASKQAGTLKERLNQLNEAFADGLLTEEEFQAKKEAMLSDF